MIPGLQLQGGRIKYRLVRGVVGNCEEFSKLLGGDRKSPSIMSLEGPSLWKGVCACFRGGRRG